MSERDTIDAARDPDEQRMRELLTEIGGIKYVVENNVLLRRRIAKLLADNGQLRASRGRLRRTLVQVLNETGRGWSAYGELQPGDLDPLPDGDDAP